MTTDADRYNRLQLDGGTLIATHVTELVTFWQAEHGLDVDGKAGPRTRASIAAESAARGGPAPITQLRCYPLRPLLDGREPQVTSEFKTRNPDRPNHNGVDFFYRYDSAIDPPMKIGDGGRTAKWFIPDNHTAIAGAAGTIVLASASKTGFRVWIDIGQGWLIGYFHLSQLDAHVGDIVELGTPIGIVGDNPVDNDARHLHFELYYGDLAKYPRGCKDPQLFLDGAIVHL